MYQHYLPGACSQAIHVLLLELGQQVELIDKNTVSDFAALNPLGQLPVLVDSDKVLREGAALVLYLLGKHPSSMLATSGVAREQAIENLMLANASLHPAYAKLFFLRAHILDETALAAGYQAAVQGIEQLWQVVDDRLARSNNTWAASSHRRPICCSRYAPVGAGISRWRSSWGATSSE